MSKLSTFIKRYKTSIILFIVLIVIYLVNKEIGKNAFKGTVDNIWELIKLVPPVFVLLGLMDVWLPKEKMIKYMGKKSGIRGKIIAFLVGSFAAGPLYASFPIAAMFMRKGVSLENIMIFIGAWACTKVPMLLIEVSALGLRFTLIRLISEIVGIIIIAKIIKISVTEEEEMIIYKNSEKL